jgi:hypothetical protein
MSQLYPSLKDHTVKVETEAMQEKRLVEWVHSLSIGKKLATCCISAEWILSS